MAGLSTSETAAHIGSTGRKSRNARLERLRLGLRIRRQPARGQAKVSWSRPLKKSSSSCEQKMPNTCIFRHCRFTFSCPNHQPNHVVCIPLQYCIRMCFWHSVSSFSPSSMLDLTFSSWDFLVADLALSIVSTNFRLNLNWSSLAFLLNL